MVVYCITCNSCHKKYIGSTKQKLHDRISQHHSSKSSAIFEHSKSHAQQTLYTVSVLQQCRNIKELLFSEAILIKRHEPALNRHHVPMSYNSLLKSECLLPVSFYRISRVRHAS